MTKEQIIKAVKVKMEEITPFDDGLMVLNAEVKPIESYISEVFQNSIDKLLMICPLSLTAETTLPATGLTATTNNGKSIGKLTIPDDFIRLHTFKMEGWERPVHRCISTENPKYSEQLNPWTRGGNSKPVIVNKGYLEIYTYNTGDTVQTSLYVKRVDIDAPDISIHDKLINPLCSLIAADVYAIFGSQQSEVMMKEVDSLLKIEL